jgi:hypothetical protein
VVMLLLRILVEERDHLIGEEGLIPVVVHFRGKLLYNGLGLHMQVSNHGVAVPMAEDLDEIDIDFAADESHGATCAQRTCTDFRCCDACTLEVHGPHMPDVSVICWALITVCLFRT